MSSEENSPVHNVATVTTTGYVSIWILANQHCGNVLSRYHLANDTIQT